MICLLCPKCQKVLSVSEAHRGGIAQCPDCGQRFRIPGAPPEPAPAAPAPPRPAAPPPAVASPPPVRRPAAPPPRPAPKPQPAAAPPRPFPNLDLSAPDPVPPPARPQAPVEDEYETLEVDDSPDPAEEPDFEVVAELDEESSLRVEETDSLPLAEEDPPEDAAPERPVPRRVRDDRDEDDDDRPRRPRRRRRRRRGSGFRLPEEIIPGLGNFLALLLIIGAVWVLLAGVALLLPPLSIFLMLLGMLLSLVGQVWFLIVAFQDDMMTGILCLFLPLYALVFLITNQDAAGRPFLISLIGGLMMVSGVVIAAMMQ